MDKEDSAMDNQEDLRMTKTRSKPNLTGKHQTELDKIQDQFDDFDSQVKSLTLDRMNEVKTEESEPQTRMSQDEINKSKDVYLKPQRTVSSKEKFNEKFRENYNHMKEYVFFIAENKEVIGEAIEIWTKPFPGMPAEYWSVPVNKAIWGPRYLAEQISRKTYHRLTMQSETVNRNMVNSDHMGTYYGHIVVDTAVPRLEARAAQRKKSIFMGKSSFGV